MKGLSKVPVLLADSLVFACVAFFCVLASLLRIENIIPSGEVLNFVFPGVAALVLIAAIRHVIARGNSLAEFAADLAALLVLCIAASWLAVTNALPVSFEWLTLGWIELPSRLAMHAGIHPAVAAVHAAAFIILVFLGAARRHRAATVVAIACLFIPFPFAHRLPGATDFAFFLIGGTLVTAAALFNRPRLFARSILAFAVFSFYLMSSSGLIPTQTDFKESHAKRLVSEGDILQYGHAFDVEPMSYERGFFISFPDTGHIRQITVYGKRIAMPGIMRTHPGKLLFSNDNQKLYALDTQNDRLMVFIPDEMRVERIIKIKPQRGSGARDIAWLNGFLYASYGRKPGFVGIDTMTRKSGNGVSFTPPNISLRDGGWAIASSQPAAVLLEQAGALVKLPPRSIFPKAFGTVVRINPDSYRNMAYATLDSPGYEIIAHPEKLLAYASSFGREIREINITSMKVDRTFRGPAEVRSMSIDPGRNLLFAAGSADGVIAAISLRNGKTVHRYKLGNRPKSVKFDPDCDCIVAATDSGVFKIDLKRNENRLKPN